MSENGKLKCKRFGRYFITNVTLRKTCLYNEHFRAKNGPFFTPTFLILVYLQTIYRIKILKISNNFLMKVSFFYSRNNLSKISI